MASVTDAEKAILQRLRTQLGNLEETIADLLRIALAQPAGELRDQLVDKVSCPDTIADVMRQAMGIPETGSHDSNQES